MISALMIGLLAGPSSQAVSLDLYRGSKLSDGGYWAVSDTYLDSTDSDKSKGGLFTLEGGKGRVVLIKFGDLERAIPQFAKITKATLYLSPSSPDKPELLSVGTVKAPWGEGPMFVATLGRATEPAPPKLAATWKQRRSGSIDWQQTGAAGPEDVSPIPGAKMEFLDKEVAIGGLATVVQNMRDRWYENNGFAITFSGPCEFFSSQAKAGKPRLAIEYTLDSAQSGPDLSVQWLTREGTGDNAAYRATVKNAGSEAAQAFSAQWIVGEKAGAKFAVNKPLGPGEETVIELKKPFRANQADHRTQSIALRLYPASPEPNANNDALEIYEDAIPVGLTGAKVQADAMQAIARRFNDVYLAQSKFSFAPDGALERIRLVPNQDAGEFVIDLAGGHGETAVLRQIATALTGIAPVSGEQKVVSDKREVAFDDPFAGLSGFGDTRYEGLIPAGIPMLYVPVASPLFDNLPIEPTDLLCGTEVAAVNAALGRKGKDRVGVLWDQPATVILRATDMTGKPLDGAELAFYQVSNGQMPDAPTQTILTKNAGTVILDNIEAGTGVLDKDALHTLKKNPFGNLRPDGSNGTILIRALVNGETEWAWLKAWQLADTYYRGNKAAAIIDIRFNAPSGPIDRAANLAKGKLLSDKAASLPAKLAPLVDDDPATDVAIGDQPGDWVEIDLGRDRPIGEVQLVLKDGTMPSKFDIQAYSTGQTAPETEAWVKDLNFPWTKANRGRKDGASVSIAYRGPTTRSRFIRIVNRSGGPGKIAEIRVWALKAEG